MCQIGVGVSQTGKRSGRLRCANRRCKSQVHIAGAYRDGADRPWTAPFMYTARQARKGGGGSQSAPTFTVGVVRLSGTTVAVVVAGVDGEPGREVQATGRGLCQSAGRSPGQGGRGGQPGGHREKERLLVGGPLSICEAIILSSVRGSKLPLETWDPRVPNPLSPGAI